MHVFNKYFFSNNKKISSSLKAGIRLIVLLCFLFAAFSISAIAETDDIDSGVYDGVNWRIDSDYHLIIGKEGGTQSFDYQENRFSHYYPWDEYRPYITEISFAGSVEGIGSFDEVLSLNLLAEEAVVESGVDAELESFVLAKIEERKEAKKAKDFAKADAIRAELLEAGIVIEDTREGVKWRKA